MRLARWTLALTVLGLEAAIVTRAWAVDRHCDYTRPGIEPWWDDELREASARGVSSPPQLSSRDPD